MAGAKGEVKPPLLENILSQPDALHAVAAHQFGAGRNALMHSAELLGNSKRIVLSGMGASLFSCIPLSYVLGNKHPAVSVVETSDLLYFRQSSLDSDTAVVLISRSGESVEVTKLLPILKRNGCRIVGVVNVPGSTLASQADEAILLNSPADQLVAIQTYTGTIAALAMLGAAYSGELEAARRELDETIPHIQRIISECVANAGHWHGFIGGESPFYFLGRGPALASVSAGVLLMHEVAKMPAVGMTPAQFRHGPIEVVSREFRAIVFVSQSATAELDRALAQDLTRIGSSGVRIVGPMGDSTLTPLCLWPENPPARFAALFETIPLQLLAYHAALARNIPIGQFRYAPAVTLSETGISSPVGAQ
jgi:glucosamine--fructose-6-phosphate aminotransferase (isomerizing)